MVASAISLANFSGALIGGQAIWTPLTKSPIFYFDARNGVTNVGGVTEWADQSGNGNNANGTTGHLATYNATGNPAGGPSIVFGTAGANTFLDVAAFSSISTGSILAVAQVTSGSGQVNQLIQGTNTGSQDWEIWTSSLVFKIWQGATISDPSAVAASSWHVIIGNYAGNSTSAIFVDSTTAAVTGNAGTNLLGSSGLRIGDTTNQGDPWEGGVCSVALFSTLFSTADITAALSWASSAFGVG